MIDLKEALIGKGNIGKYRGNDTEVESLDSLRYGDVVKIETMSSRFYYVYLPGDIVKKVVESDPKLQIAYKKDAFVKYYKTSAGNVLVWEIDDFKKDFPYQKDSRQIKIIGKHSAKIREYRSIRDPKDLKELFERYSVPMWKDE